MQIPPWPGPPLPESLEAGHARYDRAISAAAARAATSACSSNGAGITLLLVSHGEAVRRAVTRVCPGAVVYEATHCGWVECAWEAGDDDDDGDPGTWALVAGGSAGVAWL